MNNLLMELVIKKYSGIKRDCGFFTHTRNGVKGTHKSGMNPLTIAQEKRASSMDVLLYFP